MWCWGVGVLFDHANVGFVMHLPLATEYGKGLSCVCGFKERGSMVYSELPLIQPPLGSGTSQSVLITGVATFQG